jgi:heparin/heparan-sulfate lyase
MVPSFALGVLQDPYAQTYLHNPLFLPEPPRADALPVVLWRSQDVPAKPLDELPPDHFFPGTGDVVMRDGFGEDSRWIGFRCGPYLTKHNHFDQGHFAIYYQGYLAVDTGCWRGEDDLHYRNYCRRTIAHNTMLISWPGEKFSFGDDLCEANDGGQYVGVPDGFPGRRVPGERHYWFWNAIVNRRYYEDRKEAYDTGTMLGLESDGKSFACARGDATRAYNEAKIGHFHRTLLYLKPDLLLVYDQVASKITEGWLESYCEKTWLLHCMEEPQVEGEALGQGDGFKVYSGQRYAITQGSGRLNVATLLPTQTTTTVRGGPGFEFWVDGKNYPVTGEPREPQPGETWGAWRLEVRPKENRAEDVFLHLIGITEKDQEALPEHTLIDSETVAGVLLPQQAALFVKSPTPPATVRFTLAHQGKVASYLAGLAPRKPFTVATGGRKCAEGTTGEVGLARFPVEGPGEFTVTTE